MQVYSYKNMRLRPLQIPGCLKIIAAKGAAMDINLIVVVILFASVYVIADLFAG